MKMPIISVEQKPQLCFHNLDFVTPILAKASMLDHQLLDILVCPLCKGKILYDHAQQELICRFDQLAYPIRNHVPVMLPNEARDLSLEEK